MFVTTGTVCRCQKRWPISSKYWSRRYEPLSLSGVWRFRELFPFAPDEKIVTIGEGQTHLAKSPGVANFVGINKGQVYLQYEGMNPSGSFKDNGMTCRLYARTHDRC